MLDQVVVKLNRACNLRCKYCYYINDKTVDFGKHIDIETRDLFIKKYGEYCENHTIQGRVSFHGGEPLLMGKKYFRNMLSTRYFRQGILKPSIQTNGVLLDEHWIELFKEFNVYVGISLDGPQVLNDKNRIFPSGSGSYSETIRGLKLLQNSDLAHGVLCVVDTSCSGAVVFEHMVELGIKKFDFLPPILNYFSHNEGDINLNEVEKFLVDAFNSWVRYGDTEIEIRLFNELVWSYLNGKGGYSATGMKKWGSFVVLEIDGRFARNEEFIEIDRFDNNKRYYIELDVHNNSMDEVSEKAGLEFASIDHIELPTKCKSCDMNDVCLGGNIGSRYDSFGSFDNPSIHCNSLYSLSALVKKYTTHLSKSSAVV